MRSGLWFVLLVFLAGCNASGGGAVIGNPPPPANNIIAYGSGPQQFGELRLPAGNGPFPLAVVIHGGCWQRSIANYQFMSGFAQALTNAGWATWNIEYRGADDVDGGWPNTFLDVAAAVDYTRTLANNHPLDLARVSIVGHSAGGHLALWAGSRANLPNNSLLFNANPLLPAQVIGLAAITDLNGYRTEGGSCASAISKLTEETTSNPERLAETSPLAMLPLQVATTLITADGDTIVPIAQANRYLNAAGVVLQRRSISGNHFTLIETSGVPLNTLLQVLSAPQP